MPLSGAARPQPVTLSEESGVRYLHFGTEWVQGAMRIAQPYRLELEYQQQMMAPLLLLPRPRRVVQLGLGAAALTKFCYRHLRSAETVVVEIDPTVIGTARKWFGLPEQDERLTIVHADAFAFLRRPGVRASTDWLQVDLYDARARGPVYDDDAFYRACRRVLREPGIASFNLFGRSFGPSLERIAGAFDRRVFVMRETTFGNRVVLAASGPPIRIAARRLQQRAAAIEAGYGLPARRWLTGLENRGSRARVPPQDGFSL
ncbi:MAG: spermidine synthase [Burkholderiaceae bacterium]|nr:spermidine synthase [Burkholderiaceae bacterium]